MNFVADGRSMFLRVLQYQAIEMFNNSETRYKMAHWSSYSHHESNYVKRKWEAMLTRGGPFWLSLLLEGWSRLRVTYGHLGSPHWRRNVKIHALSIFVCDSSLRQSN